MTSLSPFPLDQVADDLNQSIAEAVRTNWESDCRRGLDRRREVEDFQHDKQYKKRQPAILYRWLQGWMHLTPGLDQGASGFRSVCPVELPNGKIESGSQD